VAPCWNVLFERTAKLERPCCREIDAVFYKVAEDPINADLPREWGCPAFFNQAFAKPANRRRILS
jgi:hypothetical protein